MKFPYQTKKQEKNKLLIGISKERIKKKKKKRVEKLILLMQLFKERVQQTFFNYTEKLCDRCGVWVA